MNKPIKIYNTLALLLGIGVAAIGLGKSVSADLHVPAARILVAECQGFEALATVGGRQMSCAVPDGDGVVPDAIPASVAPKA